MILFSLPWHGGVPCMCGEGKDENGGERGAGGWAWMAPFPLTRDVNGPQITQLSKGPGWKIQVWTFFFDPIDKKAQVNSYLYA